MSASDAQMELEQQQLLIEQLKALVRDRDDALQKKEKELQETNAKLSKARLQAKAKVVKKHAQAQDGKKEVEDSQKEVTNDDASSHDDGSISQQSTRAKTLLFKHKLEEKDRLIAEKEEIIRVREGQLEAKERVLAERDGLVNDLTEQLEEKTKAMEKMQGVSGGLGGDKGQIQVEEMYAQMVYKDRKIMELNAKILEQDKRVMDLQEFAGEKDQVIRGRNKVVEVLQNSIKEKDQAVQDQALLISKLTARVETTNEKVDEVTEQLRHREQELKSETERFHIKLTESQKYFEEMLQDMDIETKRLRAAIEVKDRELEVRENDLRELISKHERDIETIMSKGNVNIQDHVVQMLENKLRDTNDVLEGKIKVITVLQKENAEKEHELTESRETMRMLKEKLQVTSEQMMLLQANFVDMEIQWKEEKIRLENKMKDTAEKHETELSEKDLHLQTLQSTLSQYEAAYSQALEQYSRLQEHYQQAVAGHVGPELIQQVTSSLASNKDQQSEIDRLKNELEESQKKISQLSLQVKELESTSKAAIVVEESAGKGDTKLLKMKAQMTSRIKSLEKELQELREHSQIADDAASLKLIITELENENKDLRSKLVDFDDNKAALAELRAQIDELQIVVDTVHDQKAELQTELATTNEERLKLKQVATDLQASQLSQDQSDRVSSLSAEIKALQAELEQATNRITELEGSKTELEVALAQLKEQKDALEQGKVELLQEIETWKEKVKHEKQTDLTLEKENEELKLEVSKLTESLLGEQKTTKDQKDEINQLLSQLANLEAQLSETHESLKEAKENLRLTEEQKVDVNAELGSTTEIAARLQEQVTILKEEKLQLEEQITSLKSDVTAGHSELVSIADQATSLEGQVAILKEENLQLQEQITTLKSDLAVNQSELEATNIQLEALKDELGGEIDKLRAKNKVFVDELSDNAASLEKVTFELKTVKDENLVLQSSLVESKNSCQELELQVKQLVREIDMTKEGQNEQGKEYTDKLQTLLTQLTELENELSAEQKHSSEQQEQISQLSVNLELKEVELKSVCESFEVLKQSLGAVQLELSERNGELKAAFDSLELEKTAKHRLEEHVADISSELANVKETLSAREDSLKSLEEDKDSSIELINSALASLKAEHVSVLQENSELKSVLESTESELLTLRQTCDQLQQQAAEMSSQLDTANASIEELKASNETLQAQVAGYQEKIAMTSQSFDEDLKHSQHLIESLQEENESSKLLIASLEQQLTSVKIELEETLSASAEKDTQMSVLNVALSDQEHRQDSLQAAHQKLQTEKEQLNQQVAASHPAGDSPVASSLQEELKHAEESHMNKPEEKLQQLSRQVEDLKAELRAQESTISKLEAGLLSEQKAKLDLEQTLKKKEKLVQGLQLKAKKIAKQVKQHQDMQSSLTESQLKEKEDSFYSVSWSESSVDMSGMSESEKLYRQLLAQYQGVVIERDTLKELISEKDIEIIKLQTQFFDADLHWKEVVGELQKRLGMLQEKLDKEGVVANALQRKEQMLEEELKVTTSELMSTSHLLNESIQSGLTEAEMVSQLRLKLMEALDMNVDFENKITELSDVLQEKTASVETFQEQLLAKDTEIQSLQEDLTKKIMVRDDEIDRLQFQVRNLESQTRSLKENIKLLEIERQGRSSHIDMYASKVQELEMTLKEVTSERDHLKSVLTEKDNKIVVMEDIMKEMYGTQDTNSTSMASLTLELTAVKTEKEEMQKTLKKKDAKILALTKRIGSSTPRKQEPLPALSESFVAKESDQSNEKGVISEDVSCADLDASFFGSDLTHQHEVATLTAEVAGLRKLLKKKDAEIAAANKRLKGLQLLQGKMSSAASNESVTETSGRTSVMSQFDSRSTIISDDVQELNDRLRQSEVSRDAMNVQIRELEVELENSKEQMLNMRHELEDIQEELHFVSRDKHALENCIFDIRDMVNPQAIEQFAGEDTLYSTAESVRLLVEEKFIAEKRVAELQSWIDRTEQDYGRNSSLRATVQNLELELKNMTGKYSDTLNQLQQAVKEKCALEEQLHLLKSSPEQRDDVELESQLRESSIIIKCMKQELESLKAERDSLQQSLNVVGKAPIQQTHEHVHGFQHEIQFVSQNVHQVQVEKEEIQRHSEAFSEYIDSSQNIQSNAEEQLPLNDTNEFYINKTKELSSKLLDVEQSRAELESKLQHQIELNAVLHSEIEALHHAAEAFKQEKHLQSASLSSELAECKTRITDLRTMLKNKEAKLSALSEEFGDLALQYERIQHQKLKADTESLALKEEFEQQRSTLIHQTQEIQNLKESLSYYEGITQQLQEDSRQLKEQLSQYTTSWSQQEDKYKSLEEQLSYQQIEFQQNLKEHDDVARQFKELEETCNLQSEMMKNVEESLRTKNMIIKEITEQNESFQKLLQEKDEKDSLSVGYLTSMCKLCGSEDISFASLYEHVQNLVARVGAVETTESFIGSLQTELSLKTEALTALEQQLHVIQASSGDHIQKLQQEIAGLRFELSMLKEAPRTSSLDEELFFMKQELHSKDTALYQLQQELNALRDERDDLKHNVDTQMERVVGLESTLAENRLKMDEYEQDIQKYKNTIQSCDQKIFDLETQLSQNTEISAENESKLNKSLSDELKRNHDLLLENEQFKMVLHEKDTEISRLSTQIDTVERKISVLSDQLQQSEDMVLAMTHENSTIQQHFDDAQAKVVKLENHSMALQQRIEELNNNITFRADAAGDQEFVFTPEILEGLKSQIEELADRLQKSQNTVVDMTHERETLKLEYEESVEKMAKLESDYMVLLQELEKLKTENGFHSKESGHSTVCSELDNPLLQKVSELEEQCRGLQKTVKKRDAKIVSLSKKLEQVQLEVKQQSLLQTTQSLSLEMSTQSEDSAFASQYFTNAGDFAQPDTSLSQELPKNELPYPTLSQNDTAQRTQSEDSAFASQYFTSVGDFPQSDTSLSQKVPKNELPDMTLPQNYTAQRTQSEDSAFASQYFTSVDSFAQPDSSLSQKVPKNELPDLTLSQNDAADGSHQAEQASVFLSTSEEETSASFADADRGSLLAEISRLQAWYEYLQQQVQLGEAALQQAQTEIATLKSTIGQLPHQIIIQDESTAESSASVSELEARNNYLQQELTSSSQHVLDMTQSLQEAQHQNQAYTSSINEAQQQLHSYEEAQRDLETKVLELTTALCSAESKLKEIEDSSKHTEESFKSDVSSLEIQLRQMEEQLTAEQQFKMLMEKQLTEVQSDLKAERESKTTLENLLAEIQDHKAAMEEKLLQLESSLQENIERAAMTSNEFEQVIADLRDKLAAADTQIVEFRYNLESAKAQNEVSNKILEQLQTSSSEKEQNTIQQLRDKAEEVVILQQQLEQSTAELSELKANIVKTESRISDLQEELLSSKNELESIVSINESLREELKSKDLEIQLQKNGFEEERLLYLAEKEDLRNKVISFEVQCQELTELKQSCLAADEERQVFMEKMAALQTELETVISLQSQVEDLKSQNEVLLGNIQTNSDELTEVQGRCLSLQAEKEAFSSRVSELTELQQAYQTSIETLSQDKQVLETNITQLSETLSSFSDKHSELSDIQQILEETREQLNTMQIECQKLRQQVEEKDVVLSQQVSDLLERSQLIDTLTVARDKLMEEIKIMSSTVAEKDQKIQSLLENMQEMEDRLVQLEELSNQQTSSEQQQQSQSTNGDSTSAEIEALKAALLEKEKAYADKELMAKKAIATAKKLKFQLTQANKSLEDAKIQVMELSVENQTLQARLSVVSSEVQQSSDIVKELSQEAQKSDAHQTTELSTAESRADEQRTRVDSSGLDSAQVEGINAELESSLNMSSAPSFTDVSLEMESLQAQLATYRECCEQLQQQVQDLTEASFANESKLKQKQNLIDQLEGVKEGLKLTVTEVESAYQQLQEELETAKEDFIASKEALEKKCEILAEQAQQWKSFTDSLQQEVTVKDHRIQQMDSELQHLHAEHSESTHLKESIREKDNRLAEYSVQLESLKSVLDSESETTEELRKQLSRAEEAIEAMRSSLEEKEQAVAQSASALYEKQQQDHEKEVEIVALKESLEQQQVHFKTKEENLHSQIAVLNDEIEDYKSRLESASLLQETQQQILEKEIEIAALKESLKQQQEDFKAAEEKLHSQITILGDQIEDYKDRVGAMSTLLASSQQERDTMAAHSESLQQQLDQQGAYIAELNEIVDDLKAQVEESRAKMHSENAEELESLRANLVEFQQQVEDQSQVISTLEQGLSKEVRDESEAEAMQKSQTSEDLEDLNLQLLKYQTLVEELNGEIMALKEDKIEVTEELPNTDAEYWKANLDKLVLEKAAVEEERNQVKFELDNQQEIVKRMQEVVLEKLAQVQNLQNANEHLQSNLSALSTEKEQLLVTIDSLKGELDGMEQVIAESQFAESKAKDEVSKLKSERDQLIIRVGKLEQEFLDVQQQLQKADSPMSELAVTSEKSIKWSDQMAMEKSTIAVEHLQRAVDSHTQVTVAQQQSSEVSLKLKTTEETLRQVQGQYEKTKSRLQVAEVKCEKMLVKLKAFKDKNDKLQIQMDELQQKLGLQEGSPKRDSNLREERRRLEEQVTSLNNRLRDVETHNGKLIHDNSTLKEQLKSIEATYSKARFDEVTTELTRTQSELEDKNTALELAKSQAQELQQTVVHLTTELQLKIDEVTSLKSELLLRADSDDTILNEKLIGLQMLLTEKTAEISELKRQLTEEEELQAALNAQITKLHQELELSKMNAEATLTSELSKLRDVMSNKLTELQNELTVQNSESMMLAQEKDLEVKRNESLNEELKQLEEEITRLNEELSSEKVKTNKAEKEVLQLQQRLSEELRLKNVTEKEKEDLQMAELNSLRNQLETLQFQYDSLSQDNANYQSLTTSLTTNSSALKREVEELRFKLKKADEHHQVNATDVSIGKDVYTLTQRLEDSERERDELNEEFEGVREELVSLRREKTALTQQVGDLTSTIQQLHNQMSSLHGLSTVDEEGDTVATVKLVQTKSSGKDAFSQGQIDVLEGELADLREELAAALDENQQLRNETSGLNWKLEEASNLEQEVEDLQSELSSSAMEKKILSHDLEEVRGEMSALQTDKHLLMKEVERLSELLENQAFHEKDAVDSKAVAVHQSISDEMLQVIAAKDVEINEIQGILDLRTDQLTASLKDITAKDKLLIERDQEILALKDELGQFDHVLKDNEDMDQKIVALVEELRASQIENETLRKKFDNFNQKIDSVKSLEADFDSLNADFNKVLEEKSSMAREIDELHIKIRDLMSLHYETTFTAEQQQHVLREKETLQRRVEELEGTEGSEMEENARLKRELDKISASLQQAEFDNESLISQLLLAKTGGQPESEFHDDHKRLQAQFTEVLEQKNAVVNQLNDALHTLKQREARCQQLAMQVSQLAEDRGYLNTQLANISRSLREKEQEWLAMRHQYGDLYQAYIGAQSKNAELERRIALDSVQKELEDEETAAEADQIRGENDQAVKKLEELRRMHQSLQDTYTSVSSTLTREKALREQLERELGEAHDHIKLLAAVTNKEVHIELDDDSDTRIRETTTMLTRHGFGYCSRVHSWLKVKKDYFSFSSRQLSRVMRLRPGLRTVIWIYFVFLHIMLIACFGGFL